MKIAFVQMNCFFGQVERNINRALKLLQSEKADLYVLPELFNTGYLFNDRAEAAAYAEPCPGGKTFSALAEFAGARKCFIVAGFAEQNGDRIFNASFITGPDGYIATYRKIHLFNEEKLWFDPGDKPFFIVNVGSVRVGLMICFDWIFPESMRTLALLGADLVCHSANLVLPFCQTAMLTRCLENSIFAITANRTGMDDRNNGRILGFTGMSQITGPRGEMLIRADRDSDIVQVVDINPYQARNKFLNEHNDLLEDRRPEFYKLLR